MKNRIFALAAVCLTAFSTVALADLSRPVRFTLTQSVVAAGTVLPAGECTAESLSSQTSNEVLTLRCANNVTVMTPVSRVLHPDARAAERTEVVLQNSDGRVALRRVWLAGDVYGYELPVQ